MGRACCGSGLHEAGVEALGAGDHVHAAVVVDDHRDHDSGRGATLRDRAPVLAVREELEHRRMVAEDAEARAVGEGDAGPPAEVEAVQDRGERPAHQGLAAVRPAGSELRHLGRRRVRECGILRDPLDRGDLGGQGLLEPLVAEARGRPDLEVLVGHLLGEELGRLLRADEVGGEGQDRDDAVEPLGEHLAGRRDLRDALLRQERVVVRNAGLLRPMANADEGEGERDGGIGLERGQGGLHERSSRNIGFRLSASCVGESFSDVGPSALAALL